MRHQLLRRLIAASIGLGMLFMALIASSISVGAIDPSIFTNNGCPVGNYSCLQAANPSVFTNNGCPVGNYSCLAAAQPAVFTNRGCAVGDYACLQARLYYGYSPYYRPYGYPVSYYQPYAVVYNPYMYATQPTTTTTTAPASIVSGRAVSAGQQVTATIDGFTAGETVTASATGPNGQTLQIGSAPAAADGSVTVMITFPSAGTWQLTVHGQTSGKNVVDTYTVK